MRKIAFLLAAIMMGFTFTGIAVSSAENKLGSSIFDYKKELALTDKQEKNIKDIVAKFQAYITDKQKELNGLQSDLNKMITQSADLDKIKEKINNITKLQAEATYEDVASNRAIETELTGTQLTKWHSIQAEFIKNYQQAQQAAASKNKTIQK